MGNAHAVSTATIGEMPVTITHSQYKRIRNKNDLLLIIILLSVVQGTLSAVYKKSITSYSFPPFILDGGNIMLYIRPRFARNYLIFSRVPKPTLIYIRSEKEPSQWLFNNIFDRKEKQNINQQYTVNDHTCSWKTRPSCTTRSYLITCRSCSGTSQMGEATPLFVIEYSIYSFCVKSEYRHTPHSSPLK